MDSLTAQLDGVGKRDESLKALLKDREETILSLQRKRTRHETRNQLTQTAAGLDVYVELSRANEVNDIMSREIAQLREALQRSNNDQCRLMNDKRELTDMVERLNASILYQKQALNSQRGSQRSLHCVDDTLFSQLMNEKDSYIRKLEDEISEIRKEFEVQREQMLNEMATTLGGETTRGASQM